MRTLLEVGETALALDGELPLDFFFLILMPGTGAEFRASRNPVHSIAAVRTQESREHHTSLSSLYNMQLQCVIFSSFKPTLCWNDLDFDLFGGVRGHV